VYLKLNAAKKGREISFAHFPFLLANFHARRAETETRREENYVVGRVRLLVIPSIMDSTMCGACEKLEGLSVFQSRFHTA
jgi:hypothetical protein